MMIVETKFVMTMEIRLICKLIVFVLESGWLTKNACIEICVQNIIAKIDESLCHICLVE